MMGSSVPAAAFGATYPDRQIKLIVCMRAFPGKSLSRT
jgi:hypothetical protein